MLVVKVEIFIIVRIVIIISANFVIIVIKLLLKYFGHCGVPHVFYCSIFMFHYNICDVPMILNIKMLLINGITSGRA